MIPLIVFGLGGVTLLVLAAGLYNRLIFLKNQCDKAWFNIDVLLKQRHDEIPKLVAVCEGSKKFEQATLTQVIAARNAAVSTGGSPAARAQAEGQLSAAVGKLFALAEAYPDLKSTALFAQLSARVSQLESELADRREFYNDAVMTHNVAIESVPANVIAGYAGMHERELFKVDAADKSDVEIKFT
jgi:LemA protein